MNRFLRRAAWTVLIPLFLVAACNDPTVIGSDILPSEDDFITARIDTLTVFAKTVREDSTWALDHATYPLGAMNDPVFGRTNAGIFTQVLLPTNDINLGDPDTLMLDSALLTMRLVDIYGDTLSTHSLGVYRMLEQIENETNYYSQESFDFDPMLVGELNNFLPDLTDTIRYLNFVESPQIRIPLTDLFGQELLNLSGQPEFANDTSFLNFLPGLFVFSTDSTTPESLMEVNMNSILSRIQLFYHSTNRDSLFIELPVGPAARNTAYYTHNYTGSEVEPFLTSPDPESDSLLFLQPLGGTKAMLELPNLGEFDSVAINKATVTFTLTHGSAAENLFVAPNRTHLIAADSVGQNQYFIILRNDEIYYSIRDQLEGDSHYGGLLEIDPENNTSVYTFNITRHLQAILNGDLDNDGLLLMSFPYFREPARVVVGSPHHPDPRYRMKLNIVLTVII